MWPFRRRRPGRHELGAAVTAIPSLSQVLPKPPPLRPASNGAFSHPEDAAPVVPAQPVPPAVEEPRVELGFRDGSTAALAPGSEQAKALTEIAKVLTHRD